MIVCGSVIRHLKCKVRNTLTVEVNLLKQERHMLEA
jgi:hypothetical protein